MTIADMRRLADFLDEIATEKVIGHPIGPTDTMRANHCLLGAAYRAVAADLRACAETPVGEL